MRNDYDWQVHIEYRVDMLATYVYVTRRVEANKTEFITKGGEQHVVKDMSGRKDEDLHFARFEDEYVARLLVEALDKRGVKAPAQSFVEGKLEATSDHLQDLRKLIPKLTERED